MNYDLCELQRRYEQGYLNAIEDQRIIFDAVVSAVKSQSSRLFFIDGPDGTGKTFVENLILARVRSARQIALAVTSSEIASILLDDDRTAHSRFKISFDILQDNICDIKAQSALAELLRRTILVIWNEASAQNRYCFEAVDRTLKDVRQNDQWFEGIVVVFSGNIYFSLILAN